MPKNYAKKFMSKNWSKKLVFFKTFAQNICQNIFQKIFKKKMSKNLKKILSKKSENIFQKMSKNLKKILSKKSENIFQKICKKFVTKFGKTKIVILFGRWGLKNLFSCSWAEWVSHILAQPQKFCFTSCLDGHLQTLLRIQRKKVQKYLKKLLKF